MYVHYCNKIIVNVLYHLGQQCILFIDDLNMPEVETYGAQPPIELIRQLVDSGIYPTYMH